MMKFKLERPISKKFFIRKFLGQLAWHMRKRLPEKKEDKFIYEKEYVDITKNLIQELLEKIKEE